MKVLNQTIRHLLLTSIFPLLFVLFLLQPACAGIPITGPATISAPGEYELQNDVTNSPFTHPWNGIFINSSDVWFDGMGHTIDGIDGIGGSGYTDVHGVYAYSSPSLSNITVKNVTVNASYQGIYYNSVYLGRIQNITATNQWMNSIFLISSGDNIVQDCTATNDGGNAVGIWVGSNSNSIENIVANNNNVGFATNDAHSNYFSNLTGNNNNNGFRFYTSTSNTLVNSSFDNNGVGISVESGSDTNILAGNTISGNSGSGISLDTSGSNTIYNNYFYNAANVLFTGTTLSNIWNTTPGTGPNIIGGARIGGNYWASPGGTGFSQITPDLNADGFSDSAYSLATGNADNLPLTNLSTDPSAVISAGGTVFIGESGLDITAAVPAGSSIAWWPPAVDINVTSPTITILPPDRSNFYVDPTDFVVYTGNWYVYTGVLPPGSLAFIVKDPQLDLGIEDVTRGTDITNGAILHGDELGFLINSNLFTGAPGTPISIHVLAPGGSTYSSLTNKVGTTTSLGSVLVSSQPYHTGAIWNTANGLYPDGVYIVHAECNLNGMKDNYKNAGADYVGKTVSPAYTVTLKSSSSSTNGDGGSGDSSSPAAPAGAAPPAVQPPEVQPPEAPPANNPVSAAAPAASESYPVGFDGMSYNADGQGTLDINQDDARAAGATVTMFFDRVEVYQHHSPGLTITYWGNNFTVTSNQITGKVSHAEFTTDPLNATLGFGNVSGSVHATLPILTQRTLINNTISESVSYDTRDQFSRITSRNALTLQDIAYTLDVKKANLTTGAANVTFTIPASWVNLHGGINAVHITRISEATGQTELISTSYIGIDPSDNMIFRGDSSNGTSLFGLITAQATALEQKEHPDATYIPASKPAMITNVGMFGWLLDVIQANPVLLVAVIAVIAILVYFGWWRRRL
ncbi:MAG: DUF3821 domain-containing protein [Methanoregula sp.]